MRSIQFLAFTLVALLPTFSMARTISGSFSEALMTSKTGNPMTANKLKLPAYPGTSYSVTAKRSCKARCELSEMGTCSEQLEEFKVVANCGAEQGGVLTELGARKDCAEGERLFCFLKDPRKDGTVIVDVAFTFDSEADNAPEVAEGLEKYLSPKIVAEIRAQLAETEGRPTTLSEIINASLKGTPEASVNAMFHDFAADIVGSLNFGS